MKKEKKETPLMQQYNQIKAQYPGALLLFRVGDFYETFGEDAITASRVLDIVLTKRANGSASHIELAGFPHHSMNTYLPKLVRAGYRVAICDQLEAVSKEKKIVKRGVTELVTPGIALSDEILQSRSNNFLMAIHGKSPKIGIALLDISTGEFILTQGNTHHLRKMVQSYQPKEVVLQRHVSIEGIEEIKAQFKLDDWAFQLPYATELLTAQFGTQSLKGFGVENMTEAKISAGAILTYLKETHHPNIGHINTLSRLDSDDFVWMDPFTIRNLELIQSYNRDGVSLLEVMDRTKTPMGGRLLRKWLVLPEKKKEIIQQRLDLVKYTKEDVELSDFLRNKFRGIYDLERTISKIATQKVTPKQLQQLAESLAITQDVKVYLEKESIQEFRPYVLQGSQEVQCLIESTLSEDPPHFLHKGNVIKKGVSSELDGFRDLLYNSKGFLEDLRLREAKASGISSLKIAFNNVFGYYLEVRNRYKDQVPEQWTRKQTLVNAERYITEELKTYEVQILSAESKILDLETQLFTDLLAQLPPYFSLIQSNAFQIAQMDILTGFAQLALAQNYHQPELVDGKELDIKNGRHPVIEYQLAAGEKYIPNDVYLDRDTQQIIVITGPNMSGKSAVLRQTALIVLMAQIGSFVPADSAVLGIIDKLFTRVGASDNLSTGESTFMVEMNETASILNNLSERSLIILDELGRGTSTYDGISLAWAIAEYLHQSKEQPKTLFATHYHELNEMQLSFSRIKNFHISVKEIKGKIHFLRKLVPGGSEHSFGINVAEMAGVPSSILKRAQQLLLELEKKKQKKEVRKKLNSAAEEQLQLSIFQLDDPVLEQIRDELISTEIDALTPVDALVKLSEIKKLLGK